MEDPKRHEYAAFRTFEFIFRIPEHLDFDRLNRESTSTNEMRYKLLCKLMSLGICKACAGLVDNRDKRDDHRYNRTLNAIALWMKINHKKIAHVSKLSFQTLHRVLVPGKASVQRILLHISSRGRSLQTRARQSSSLRNAHFLLWRNLSRFSSSSSFARYYCDLVG